MALLSRKTPVQTDCGSELDTENPQDPFGRKHQTPPDRRHFVVARIHENIDPNDFGKTEGVALTLDGINLSPAVYETFGLDELLAALSPIFRDRIAEYHGCHTTNTSTELYLYGPSADQILLAIAPVQKEFPLCRKSRTRKIIPQDNNKSD